MKSNDFRELVIWKKVSRILSKPKHSHINHTIKAKNASYYANHFKTHAEYLSDGKKVALTQPGKSSHLILISLFILRDGRPEVELFNKDVLVSEAILKHSLGVEITSKV